MRSVSVLFFRLFLALFLVQSRGQLYLKSLCLS